MERFYGCYRFFIEPQMHNHRLIDFKMSLPTLKPLMKENSKTNLFIFSVAAHRQQWDEDFCYFCQQILKRSSWKTDHS